MTGLPLRVARQKAEGGKQKAVKTLLEESRF
jgi:hypothetical protein